MYQLTNLLEEINCDIMEYAYLTIDTLHYADSFKLHIPKIMAPEPFAGPNNWIKGLSPGIFKNDAACKVTPSSTIGFQNYVVIYRHLDKDFSMRARPDQHLNMGQQFIVTFMNHDPRDCKIIQIM